MTEIPRISPEIIVFDRKLEKGFISVGFELKVVNWTEVDALTKNGHTLVTEEEAIRSFRVSGAVDIESVNEERKTKQVQMAKEHVRRQWQYQRFLAKAVGEKDPADYSDLSWVTVEQRSHPVPVFERGIKLEMPQMDYIPRAVLAVTQSNGEELYYKFVNKIHADGSRELKEFASLS